MKKVAYILIFCCLPVFAMDPIPPLNLKVKEYVTSVMGKKVGRGECWDLAKAALDHAGAKWDGDMNYGRLYDPKKETPMPGDIVQFEGVAMEHREGNSLMRWTMLKHTAVVYEVSDARKMKMAEQNMNKVRKVMVNEYALDDVKKGKLLFYRPQK